MRGARWAAMAAVVAIAPLLAADIKVDLSKEQVGRPPKTFEPMVGTWLVAQDGPDKVVMVDGRPWVASKDNPTRLLIETARRLYGTSNEELMDNAKQFAYFPVAVATGIDSFSNGTISVKFKTIAGDADRASGILFNVKPNGDWLAIRYNDTEHNVALWQFHNGIRRRIAGGPEGHPKVRMYSSVRGGPAGITGATGSARTLRSPQATIRAVSTAVATCSISSSHISSCAHRMLSYAGWPSSE